MSIANFPGMLVSERQGWPELDRSVLTQRAVARSWVMVMSLIPPALYAYAELNHPGAIFPLTVPALTTGQLITTGIVFYLAELAMVSFIAMMIQRISVARDHDPGYDRAYALAAVTATPLWLAFLALLVPSLVVAVAAGLLGLVGAISLIHHGVRPLLHISDEKIARHVAETVTLVGIVVWIGLTPIAAMVLSLLLQR